MARAPRFAWEQAMLRAGPKSPTTRHVLLTLATHADKTMIAYPAIRTLMEETQLHEHAVVDHIKVAIDLGWLVRHGAKGEGKAWKRSIYRLTVPDCVVLGAAREAPGAVVPTATPFEGDGVAVTGDGVALRADGVAPQADLVLRDAQSNNVLSTSKNTKSSTTGANPLSDPLEAEQPKTQSLEQWGEARGMQRQIGETEVDWKKRLTRAAIDEAAGRMRAA